MNSISDLQARLQTVRGHYRVSPWIQPRDDEAPLLRSWQRCRDAGMREGERVNFELVSRSILAELDDQHGELVRSARPETERLAHALRGTGCTVLLFNARGVIIDRLCHEAATPSLLLHATRKGVNVSERCVGTTGASDLDRRGPALSGGARCAFLRQRARVLLRGRAHRQPERPAPGRARHHGLRQRAGLRHLLAGGGCGRGDREQPVHALARPAADALPSAPRAGGHADGGAAAGGCRGPHHRRQLGISRNTIYRRRSGLS